MVNSVIPIWKPIDWTSFDVVKKIRNQIKPTKVGHAGTLDPFAEGVLMVCTGKYTKIIESFMMKEKEYVAKIQLGSETDTLDPTGNIVARTKIPVLNRKIVQKVLDKFIGNIQQEPPMFSALKMNGQPLYKLARKGITVERKKRQVTIYDIQLQDLNRDSMTIKSICGRGTYIRSLAKDISEELGTVGHLISLKRTRVGEYDENSCISINEYPQWLSVRI